jgi:hypothetical protein
VFAYDTNTRLLIASIAASTSKARSTRRGFPVLVAGPPANAMITVALVLSLAMMMIMMILGPWHYFFLHLIIICVLTDITKLGKLNENHIKRPTGNVGAQGAHDHKSHVITKAAQEV